MSAPTLAAARVRAAVMADDLERRIRTKHGRNTPAEVMLAFSAIAAKLDTEYGGKESPRGLRDFLIVLLGGPESIEWNRLTKLPESEADALTDTGDALVEVKNSDVDGDAL